MKRFVFSLFAIVISFQSYSQDFDLPVDWKLETKEDYAKYEKDIINAVDWLIKTPVDNNRLNRKEVNAFLLAWLTGSPNVSIELSEEIVTFGDCADCLMIFMGGWAKYSLQNNDFTNKTKGNLAGIESVIQLYNKNKAAIGTNKAIEKYIKLKEKGKLETYIESKM